ncbi:hypothetical protein Taro_005490 [Colocasia esculenta]|uniref:Uncharacterized protein n=1 Tax=Colocasia esculenta TaxID=4460 RepID=A0A843TUH7_COLES|nr:hypothetical protein [Colocasia esculenta]
MCVLVVVAIVRPVWFGRVVCTVGCPRFSVSLAVSSGLCPGTCVVPSRSVSSDLDTLTPVFELYVRLRERRQWDSDCRTYLLVTCNALVVGGTDTSSRHWSPTSPFPVPHSREPRPGSPEVSGMGLRPCGPQKFEMADKRDWGGGGDDPEESTQRMIERIWESLTDIQRRMDQ